jgi:sugar phosphate isomerase/epimerase
MRIGENVARVVRGVDSEWFGALLDVGNFGRGPEAYESIELVAPLTVFCHAKMLEMGLGWSGLDWYWEEKILDYKRIMGILRAVGFNGHLSLEWEGEEAEETAVPKCVRFLKHIAG